MFFDTDFLDLNFLIFNEIGSSIITGYIFNLTSKHLNNFKMAVMAYLILFKNDILVDLLILSDSNNILKDFWIKTHIFCYWADPKYNILEISTFKWTFNLIKHTYEITIPCFTYPLRTLRLLWIGNYCLTPIIMIIRWLNAIKYIWLSPPVYTRHSAFHLIHKTSRIGQTNPDNVRTRLRTWTSHTNTCLKYLPESSVIAGP